MNEKLTEDDMLAQLRPGAVLLPPLVIRSADLRSDAKMCRDVDALLELELPNDKTRFSFAVEAKSRATPEAIHTAASQAKANTREGEWPMIQVPFLGPKGLAFLEQVNVAGVDLCGNGLVIIPGRLWVVRSGRPNLYRDSRPLNNPYRGRSALVARTLLNQSSWPTLKKMVGWILESGADLSLAQASKAVRALEEDLIVSKAGGTIKLQDPALLLDKLGSEWRKVTNGARQAFRLSDAPAAWAARLSSNPALRWAVIGESSAARHLMFAQGGPRRIAVSDLSLASALLDARPEPAPNFADVELLESDEPGFYFDNEMDETGIRWASRLQTWLELQAGDARQKDAGRELRPQILEQVRQ